jgi:uncharacterized protein YkwD
MRNRRTVFWSCICASAFLAPLAGRASRGPISSCARFRAYLSLNESRNYLLELINRDRASLGFKPVEIDEIATQMAQAHSEEMAAHGYLAHWDRQGRPPDQRYTVSGGKHFVQENVYLLQEGGGIIGPEPLIQAPEFTRTEIENIEAAYFNQRPPNDGHRRNIIASGHTHVGIGLAKAGTEFGASSIANCQEFINRYIDVEPIPKEAKVGEKISIAGRLDDGFEFDSITVGRQDAPQPMSVSDLKLTRRYSIPRPYAVYRSYSGLDSQYVKVQSNGSFSLGLTLSDEKRSGLYYVTVKVVNREGRVVVASQRTILVK